MVYQLQSWTQFKCISTFSKILKLVGRIVYRQSVKWLFTSNLTLFPFFCFLFNASLDQHFTLTIYLNNCFCSVHVNHLLSWRAWLFAVALTISPFFYFHVIASFFSITMLKQNSGLISGIYSSTVLIFFSSGQMFFSKNLPVYSALSRSLDEFVEKLSLFSAAFRENLEALAHFPGKI